MEPTPVNLNKDGLKYGAIIGAINVIIYLLVYIIKATLFASGWLSFILFLLNIGILIFVSRRLRKTNGGFVRFNKLFQALVLTTILSGFIGLAFNTLLYTVIDPQLPTTIRETLKQNTYEFMQKWNVPQDKIDETMKKMDKEDPNPSVKKVSIELIFVLIGSMIISLIFAAIFKKNDTVNYESLLDSGQNQQG